jgi:hypothetical protein
MIQVLFQTTLLILRCSCVPALVSANFVQAGGWGN